MSFFFQVPDWPTGCLGGTFRRVGLKNTFVATKSELYKRIKIAGILSVIPFVLAAGAAAGYFMGDYLEKKFLLPHFYMPICIGIGLLTSVMEVARIIRLAVKIDRKN
jgi:hypothetical protein